MKTEKTIAKNATFLLVGEVISNIFSFLLIVAISRYLGDVGLGKYSFIYSFVGLFMICSDIGLSTLMIRDIAKNKKNTRKYVNNIMALKLVLGLLSLILPSIIILFMQKTNDIVIGTIVLAIAMFFYYYGMIFESLFQAYERMEFSMIMKVIERAIALVLVFTALILTKNVLFVMCGLAISHGTAFMVGWFFAKKKIIKVGFEFDIKFWKKLIKESYPFWFSLLFFTIYFNTDTIMLSLMKNYQVTGWYSAARKIISALYFVPTIVSSAVYPAMSKLHVSSKNKLKALFEKSFYYLLLIALPMGIGITMLAKRIIIFIYQEQFIEASACLQVLIWACFFIYISYIMGFLLNSINKQILFTASAAICVVVNIILNYALIPKYSHIGAGIATVITEMLNFLMLYIFISRNGFKLNFKKLLIKPIIAGAAMGIVIYFIQSFHLILSISIAMLVYFSILFIIGGIGKDEINILKSFLPKTQKTRRE